MCHLTLPCIVQRVVYTHDPWVVFDVESYRVSSFFTFPWVEGAWDVGEKQVTRFKWGTARLRGSNVGSWRTVDTDVSLGFGEISHKKGPIFHLSMESWLSRTVLPPFKEVKTLKLSLMSTTPRYVSIVPVSTGSPCTLETSICPSIQTLSCVPNTSRTKRFQNSQGSVL